MAQAILDSRYNEIVGLRMNDEKLNLEGLFLGKQRLRQYDFFMKKDSWRAVELTLCLGDR